MSENRICSECSGLLVKSDYQLVCRKCGLVEESDARFVDSFMQDSVLRKRHQAPQFGKVGGRMYMGGEYKNRLPFLHSNKVRLYAHINAIGSIKLRITSTIHNIGKILQLKNQIINTAEYLYFKISSNYKIKNHIVLSASCIYCAIKMYKFPLSLQAVITEYNKNGHRTSCNSINRCMFTYRKFLKIPPLKPEDYLEKITSVVFNNTQCSLNQKNQIKNIALQLINKKNMHQHRPQSTAASALIAADRIVAIKYNTKKILRFKSFDAISTLADYTIRDVYHEIFADAVNNFKSRYKKNG